MLRAGANDSPEAQVALARLCRTYWYPLYAYVRRQGRSEPDAQDLVQGFFAQLLGRGSLVRVMPKGGRFRSYLLGALNYYLADRRDAAHAKKRGGGQETVSFDAMTAEERYRLEPADARSPERLFSRRWALTVLDTVLARLERDYRAQGKGVLFDRLQACLLGDHGHGTFGAVALELGLSEGAVKMAALRLRQRYRELIHELIAETVSGPEEVGEEVRFLLAAVSQ